MVKRNHRKITTIQPEHFDGIRSIPINQIEVPPCFKEYNGATWKTNPLKSPAIPDIIGILWGIFPA